MFVHLCRLVVAASRFVCSSDEKLAVIIECLVAERRERLLQFRNRFGIVSLQRPHASEPEMRFGHVRLARERPPEKAFCLAQFAAYRTDAELEAAWDWRHAVARRLNFGARVSFAQCPGEKQDVRI